MILDAKQHVNIANVSEYTRVIFGLERDTVFNYIDKVREYARLLGIAIYMRSINN